MKDHLKNYCSDFGIKLIYTNNSVTVLSSAIKNNIPFVRAHSIFKDCSGTVANAVVRYFMGLGDRKESLEIIESYIEECMDSTSYKIIPPNQEFKDLFRNTERYGRCGQNDDLAMVEAGIVSITQRDFWGTTSMIKHGSTIKVSSDDLVELDIIISD